ncbi:hypothetical protein MC7420_5043 [Coleofasciculus chthonoplastes PCC 7420]|uniref:Uncharacterized protein n=1 Tax=Coleofasciculus chthonoplastes PCC 7420 TaxID=118168 RepID=B4W1D5_9CYAN|nr:hypothetical protein MC7420_5043 [Coleofasciculus chthonoplastes PCC 7420]
MFDNRAGFVARLSVTKSIERLNPPLHPLLNSPLLLPLP